MSSPAVRLSRDQKKNQIGSEKSFREFSMLIQANSGINLLHGKETLIETRLRRRLTEMNLSSLEEYLPILKVDKEELQVCIELMTTHKTEWFREYIHFEWLKKELARLRSKQEPIRIWSAACSSGHEVYSLLLFLLREGIPSRNIQILGTDISRPILDAAMELPETEEFDEQVRMLEIQTGKKEWVQMEVQNALRTSIKFREFNLIESSLASPILFDVIFLRNVLIYFDRPTVNKVCRGLSKNLKVGGQLVLGLSESLQGELPEFESIGSAIYKFKGGRNR